MSVRRLLRPFAPFTPFTPFAPVATTPSLGRRKCEDRARTSPRRDVRDTYQAAASTTHSGWRTAVAALTAGSSLIAHADDTLARRGPTSVLTPEAMAILGEQREYAAQAFDTLSQEAAHRGLKPSEELKRLFSSHDRGAPGLDAKEVAAVLKSYDVNPVARFFIGASGGIETIGGEDGRISEEEIRAAAEFVGFPIDP